MIRVWRTSGEEVTTVSPEQLAELVGEGGRPVVAMKRYLQSFCGQPRFRQRLILESGVALEDDADLEGSAELQLVLLPLRNSTKALCKEFIKAVSKNSVQKVEQLLNSPVDPNLRDPREGSATPLCLTCHHGFLEVTRLLLEAQANPDTCLADGAGTLFLACRGDHLDTVKLLLEHRTSPDLPEHGQAIPLIVAASMGTVEASRLLLEARADPTKKSDREGAFFKAAAAGSMEMVKMMLEFDLDKAEALLAAASRNQTEVASLVLEARADPNKAYDVTGTTPLALAAKEGHMEASRLLLRARADLNLPTPHGVTPLVAACAFGSFSTAELLMENLADLNMPASNGTSPLLGACKYRSLSIVRRLLLQGAKIHQASPTGETPLFVACQSGSLPIIRELLEQKADKNMANNQGVTPLQYASEKGLDEVIRLLEEAHVMDEGSPGELSSAGYRATP
ncbi:ANK1 [Symbiodinium natans]|uniref:ANK1 protein n=1 Tax=Symbiodinium natans TaxID=878477 RepID=A0A812P9D2_9DINO|nr:ANK1 [Symbiodinium natans]